MDPLTTILVLFAAAVVLVALEMLLPTHGALGVAGAVAACGAIAVAFRMDARLGAGLLVASLVAAPFVFTMILSVWERSPIGRRLALKSSSGPHEHERIEVGDVGQTIAELRPMGVAEFGPVSVQAVAHRGTIPAGTRVRVIDYQDGVATVVPTDASHEAYASSSSRRTPPARIEGSPSPSAGPAASGSSEGHLS